jgi:hypothetical protein
MKEIKSLIERAKKYLKSAETLKNGEKFVEKIVQYLKEKEKL